MSTAVETFTVGGPNVAWRETGGEIVILDLAGAVYFGLNGTGAQLWKRLLAGASRAQLVDELAGGPDKHVVNIKSDIDTFLTDLDSCGLLRSNALEN
jgi:hypothetical protein